MRRNVLSRRGLRTRNLNRRRAIRHHCHMCCNFDWQAVIDCRRTDCPLFAFRRGRRPAGHLDPTERAAAIGRFCTGCRGVTRIGLSDCDAEDCTLYPYRHGGFD